MILVELSQMLAARDRRVERQSALLAQYRLPLVSFTLNIAGPVKNGPEIRRLFALGRGLLFDTPEKALLDLLYLNPYYKTEQDMEELRLDEDFMQNEFRTERLADYLARIGSKTLTQRVKRLLKTYDL